LIETIHEIEFELTDELAEEFARVLVGREMLGGWRRMLPAAVFVILAATAIVLLGLQGWITPAVASVLLLVLAFPVGFAMVRRRYAHQMAMWGTMLPFRGVDRTVRVRFSHERVHMETSVADGGGTWNELHELVIFPEFWLLRFVTGVQIALPRAVLSAELDAFIRRKADEARALVREA